MSPVGVESILSVAGKWLVGKLVGAIAERVGEAIKPTLLQRAVEDAVSAATSEAARKVGKPGAEALADSLIDNTGNIVLRMLFERRATLSNSEDIEEFQRNFISAYPEDLDEAIAPFTRGEAKQFLDTFLQALDDNLWSTEPLRSLRETVSQRHTEQTVDAIAREVLPETDTTKIMERAIVAAQSDLDRFWTAYGKPAILVERTMLRRVEGKDDQIEKAELLGRIRRDWRGRLVAEPGAGKTTWLLAVADSLLIQQERMIPVLVPITEISHGQHLFSVLSKRRAFEDSGVDESELRKLAREGLVVVICDGWNELSSNEQRLANIELTQLIRDYPTVALLIATRPSVSAPRFPTNELVFLTPLTTQQQYDYLEQLRGDEGVNALRIAKGNNEFSDLFQNPLFLSIFAELDYSESLPNNRESLLEHFVSIEEAKPYNCEQLRAFFAETHRDYLIRVGAHLTSQGTAQGSLNELRPIVLACGRGLADSGQIATAPAPADVLEKLSSHTNLCRTLDESESAYRFQHQQFQEWFASHIAEDAIQDAFDNVEAPPSIAAKEFADRVSWEEAVLFGIERMTCSGKNQRDAAVRFILETLGVDTSLAGQMISRVSDEVWELIESPVVEFVNDWRVQCDVEGVLNFVVLSGRPDFEDLVWEYYSNLESKYQGGNLRWRRGFNPRVLGKDWGRKLSDLGEEERRSLIYDLAYDGGEIGIEYAFEAAIEEKSERIVSTVIEALIFRRNTDYLEKLLSQLDESAWKMLAGSLDPDDLPSQRLKEKHQSVLETLLDEETDAEQKIRHRFRLIDYGSDQNIVQLINDVLTSKADDRWAAHERLKRLSELRPKLVSEEIVGRIIAGEQVPHHARELVIGLSDEQASAILDVIEKSEPDLARRLAVSDIAVFLSKSYIATIVDTALALDDEISSARPAPREKVEKYRDYQGLVQACDVNTLAIVVADHTTVDPKQIAWLSTVLAHWGDLDSRSGPLPIEPELKSTLVEKIRGWGERLVEEEGVSRRTLVAVANAIGRIGKTTLTSLLKQIVDRELDLHQEEISAAEKAGAKKHLLKDNWAHMYYDNQLGQAFDGVHGDEARGILVEYLSDSRFSRAAARALIPYCKQPTAHVGAENQIRGFTPSVLGGRRSARDALGDLDAPHPVAEQLLNRVLELLSLGDEAAVYEALDLACCAACMDYGNSKHVFDDVLAAPITPRGRCKLLRTLSMAGERIHAVQISPGLKAAEKEYFAAKWRSENDFWMLSEWLELLASSDDPIQFVNQWESYPEPLRQHYRLRDLVAFLELAPKDEGLRALDQLVKIEPRVRETHQWVVSISRIDTIDSAKVFLEYLFSKGGASSHLHSMSDPIIKLADMLRQNTELREYAFDLYEKAEGTNGIRALYMIFQGLGDEEAFFEIVDRISDRADCPMFKLARSMLRALCEQRRPIDGSTTSYEILPASVASLRQRLWTRIDSDPENKARFDALLQRIDELRRDSGTLGDDPRHPDLATGHPWPRSASLVWDRLANDELS